MGKTPFKLKSGNSPLKKGRVRSIVAAGKAFFGAGSDPFLAAKLAYKRTRQEK